MRQISRASKLTKGATPARMIALSAAAYAVVRPAEKIAVAKSAVQRAEQSGAPEFATGWEMRSARDKLGARPKRRRPITTSSQRTQCRTGGCRCANWLRRRPQRTQVGKAAMEFDARHAGPAAKKSRRQLTTN